MPEIVAAAPAPHARFNHGLLLDGFQQGSKLLMHL
jgi:hypothetical protein